MDLRRLPSPDDLLILLTVARLGRFNAVAETLGTTHTTISRRILALDKQLGGRTLERSPHGWELTDLGNEAVAAAEAIEGTLGALTNRIARSEDVLSGLVRISTPTALAPGSLRRRSCGCSGSTRCSTSKCSAPPARSARTAPAWTSKWWWATWTSAMRRRSSCPTISCGSMRDRSPREHGLPETLDDVRRHGFVSYVESALRSRNWATAPPSCPSRGPASRPPVSSPSWRPSGRGAGIGLLPNFLVVGDPMFRPVLPDDFQRQLHLGGGTARNRCARPPSRPCWRRSGPRFPAARPYWQAEPSCANGNSPGPAVRGPGCCR